MLKEEIIERDVTVITALDEWDQIDPVLDPEWEIVDQIDPKVADLEWEIVDQIDPKVVDLEWEIVDQIDLALEAMDVDQTDLVLDLGTKDGDQTDLVLVMMDVGLDMAGADQTDLVLDTMDVGLDTIDGQFLTDGLDTTIDTATEMVGTLGETIDIPDTTMFHTGIFLMDTLPTTLQEISSEQFLIDLSIGITG
jgi:hypothetical protein